MSCTRNKTFKKLCELTSGDRFLWVVKGRPMVTNIFEVEDPVIGTYRLVGKYSGGVCLRVDLYQTRPIRTERPYRAVQRVDVLLRWEGVEFKEPK